jgi:hypothetical protein
VRRKTGRRAAHQSGRRSPRGRGIICLPRKIGILVGEKSVPASVRANNLKVLWVVVLAAMAGSCASAGVAGQAPAAPPPPLAAQTRPPASRITVHASRQRLQVDLPRAVRRMHWALARMVVAQADDGDDQPALRVHAVHPNERQVWIIARPVDRQGQAPTDDQAFEITVQVGHFGNPAQEQAYIQMLQKTLADKPVPLRNARFQLP